MIKLILLIIIVSELLFDKYKLHRIWKQRAKPLPKEVADIYDNDRYQQFLAYKKDYKKVGMIDEIFSLIVTFVVLFTPFMSFIDTLSNNMYGVVLYSILFLEIILGLKSLVSSYYSTFYIEEKYGLNKKTKKEFFKDYFLYEVFGLVVNILLNLLLVFIVQKLLLYCQSISLKEAIMWIVGIYVLFYVIIKVIQLISVGLMKIQYKFTPLEDGELKDKINLLQADSKKKVKHIYVYNESKKTTGKNAFLLKFMWYREFSIADNFMDGNSEDELLGVFAHEIGHLKHKKSIYEYMSYLFGIVSCVVLIYLVDNVYLIENFINEINILYGLKTINCFLVIEVFTMLLKPILFVDGLYSNYVSRLNEYEADYNAVKHGYGKALIKTFKALSSDELVDVNPDWLWEVTEYSHPGMYNRIRYIEKKDEELFGEKNSISESIS